MRGSHPLLLVVAVSLLGCDGTSGPGPDDPSAPSLAAGRDHVCVSTDAIYCWGSNQFAQLGQASTTETCTLDGVDIPCSTAPLRMSAAPELSRLSGGHHHTCGLTANDEAYCWGWNAFGQLGDGTTTNRAAPVPVSGGHRFAVISAGTFHTCGLTEDGVAYCWGAARYGVPNDTAVNALGVPVSEVCQNPTPSYRGAEWPCTLTPRAAGGALRFRAIDAGVWATCAVATDGTSYCWGWNQFWSLGTGDGEHRGTAAKVATAQVFTDIYIGVGHACGLNEARAAYCWGSRNFHWGQLGFGHIDAEGSMTPGPVVGGHAWSRLHLPKGNNIYSGFTCGITTQDEVHCWGSNRDGQLAVEFASEVCDPNSGFTCTGTPVTIPVPKARTVAAGTGFACALTLDGEVYCWGGNDTGQLGDGTTASRAAPRLVNLP